MQILPDGRLYLPAGRRTGRPGQVLGLPVEGITERMMVHMWYVTLVIGACVGFAVGILVAGCADDQEEDE